MKDKDHIIPHHIHVLVFTRLAWLPPFGTTDAIGIWVYCNATVAMAGSSLHSAFLCIWARWKGIAWYEVLHAPRCATLRLQLCSSHRHRNATLRRFALLCFVLLFLFSHASFLPSFFSSCFLSFFFLSFVSLLHCATFRRIAVARMRLATLRRAALVRGGCAHISMFLVYK